MVLDISQPKVKTAKLLVGNKEIGVVSEISITIEHASLPVWSDDNIAPSYNAEGKTYNKVTGYLITNKSLDYVLSLGRPSENISKIIIVMSDNISHTLYNLLFTSIFHNRDTNVYEFEAIFEAMSLYKKSDYVLQASVRDVAKSDIANIELYD
ncbi:MAG: hypothetical protein HY376_02050 [Candidatus Blackburnbacteria bacterium]|nr:hypothetical protein [Candidatus Blackburnbacteria bacterium]